MNFFLKKLLIVIPTLYIAWTVVFVTLNIIPGDPVNLMLGGRPASDEVRENVRKNLGLDKATASADSEGIEHHVSNKTLIKMEKFNKSKK